MYNPSLHTATNKPIGITGKPVDGRTYYYDEVNFKYRAYISTSEVLGYLPGNNRVGQFPIIINTGGTLLNGVITGGTNSEWWFANGILDADLIKKFDGSAIGGYVAIIGIIPDPDLINSRSSGSMAADNLLNPLYGSGCNIESYFGDDPLYGSQIAISNDSPARQAQRTRTNGTWSDWDIIAIETYYDSRNPPDPAILEFTLPASGSSVGTIEIPTWPGGFFQKHRNRVMSPQVIVKQAGLSDPYFLNPTPVVTWSGENIASVVWNLGIDVDTYGAITYVKFSLL